MLILYIQVNSSGHVRTFCTISIEGFMNYLNNYYPFNRNLYQRHKVALKDLNIFNQPNTKTGLDNLIVQFIFPKKATN